MAQTGCSIADMDLAAVSAGPGSFTGLRIGMAYVKGLCLPHALPVAAVSTLEALADCVCGAFAYQEYVLITALDARRSEVYGAAFVCTESGQERLCADMAGKSEELEAAAAQYQHLPVVFVGDGAQICYNAFNYFETKVIYDKLPDIVYGTARIGAAMHLAGQSTAPGAARPVYLRLSQAERQRRERLADM